jgi:type IV fimbrial biogenesis protein FimT
MNHYLVIGGGAIGMLTALELCDAGHRVTLAVAIILLAVGMPLFNGVVANNRATTQANALMSAMKLARSEAVKRAIDVSVCATNEAQDACDTESPPDWTNGWFVYADDDGSFDFPGDVLRTWSALAPTAAVSVSYPGTSNQVVFNSIGERADDDVAEFGFETNDTRASGSDADRVKRCIVVNAVGQVRVRRYDFSGSWACP